MEDQGSAEGAPELPGGPVEGVVGDVGVDGVGGAAGREVQSFGGWVRRGEGGIGGQGGGRVCLVWEGKGEGVHWGESSGGLGHWAELQAGAAVLVGLVGG